MFRANAVRSRCRLHGWKLSLLLTAFLVLASSAPATERPNIILILVDDMGYSDIGCYGGEIRTPHLDGLAQRGLRFTQFYNCAKCETTRATLLTGRYAPEVGVGKLNNAVTLAEALQPAGYTTLMSGKWHMSAEPTDRGFDRYFGHLSGATNFFTGDNTFRLDGKPFEVPKSGFYTTDADTDYAIKFIHEADRAKPFFLYLAYNAPHYPLQAPEAEVRKYMDRYREGWDKLREERLARMKELGIVSAEQQLSPRPDDVPAWESLDDKQRERENLMMATFAAMVDRVDQNIGRLTDTLRELEEFDNTLILFLSDNGACPFQRTKPNTIERNLMPWDPESYWTYDKGWAHACNTPWREYKQNQHEGGISTPLIAHWPKGIATPGQITHQPGHLVDFMTTFLDLAETQYPSEYQGRSVGPARGRSLRPIFAGQQREPHEAIYFTFYGKNNALRAGDFKLVNRNNGPWELYDIARDRTEGQDLSTKNTDKFAELKKLWAKYNSEIGAGRAEGGPSGGGPGKRRQGKQKAD
ncbi:MAG: arylsulfatase [Planctomycetaceae bacterium]|nr:arylsulfatase [Planctomycetaceae bacterium]